MNSSFRGHGIWLLRSSGKNLHFWSSQRAQYYRFYTVYTFCDGNLFLRFSSFKPLILRIWKFSCHSHSRAWGTKGSVVIDGQAIHAKTMDTPPSEDFPWDRSALCDSRCLCNDITSDVLLNKNKMLPDWKKTFQEWSNPMLNNSTFYLYKFRQQNVLFMH